jgi:thiol-disulfide isomerase/thioredoxin
MRHRLARPAAAALAALALGATLYAGQPGAANAAALDAADRTALKELRAGDMEKLVVHAEPKPRIDEPFRDGMGSELGLADFAGKVVVLNFWATWCPPCRAEMPSLDRLAAAEAGEDVAVVTLSNDIGGVEKPRRFFEEEGIETLDLYHDPGRRVAREAGIMGLPVTLLLDRRGREVARLVGDAEWDSDSARAIIRALAERTAPGA